MRTQSDLEEFALHILKGFVAIIFMSYGALYLAVLTISGPVCPGFLNADWGKIERVSTHYTLWGFRFWGGRIHCYSKSGELVPDDKLTKVPLNGCPADASLESIAATRTLIDKKCKGDLFLEDLASHGVLTGDDGRVQLFNRSSDHAIRDESTDGTVVFSEYIPHNRVDRLAPMAKDLWVAQLASNRADGLVFRKVDSLHRGDSADVVDKFVTEDGASFTGASSRGALTAGSSKARLRAGHLHTGTEGPH